ncbi:transcriptional regulator [Paenibacillus darwinianus]|uniref:Transcriptional regulator n=1 Tax=Paenibacillus darwinianus TaxID=1380763 RepID=A0A9W5S3Q5_9BACL|nr:sugar-binding transcriptional regulator [Paenibacillus darwinianus]EXX86919.1 transcriptional regulator [Paenibacillus darwinianus]EXX90662.1 transcriptional regulator [Paenibacillus darwinianus]EXX91624.1 transcriptional regulator [Paenibacillus darwinianus]
MNDAERKFLLKISRMYYFDEWTQAEIAKKVGVSRPIISKGLQKARSEGLVEIIIHDHGFDTIEMENRIESAFGLEDVIVVPSADMAKEAVRTALSKAAASYLQKQLKDAQKIGVSWGTALNDLVKEYPSDAHPHLKVIPMVGGMGSHGIELHANQIAFELSKKLDCQCESLYAPAIVETAEFRNLLLSTPEINRVLAEAKSVDVALVGIGNPFNQSTMKEIGYLGDAELQSLKNAKVAGDINSCFILEDGSIAQNTLNERVIGINTDDLRQAGKVIAVAEGLHKTDSIIAALKGGYINAIITEEQTASDIVSKLEQ